MTQQCPKCDRNDCFIETENQITKYICVGCGYSTQSNYHIKNLEFQSTVYNLDKDLKKMIWISPKDFLYWFPLNFEIPKLGVLYPNGTVDDITWLYMPMIDLSDQEKKKYPNLKERPDEYRKKYFTIETLKEVLITLKIIS